MSQQVLTANRLRDGHVVYRTADKGWSTHIGESLIASTDEAHEALTASGQASVAAQEVNDPYLIDVETVDGRPRASRYREIIRASGPSVAPAFNTAIER